MILSLGLDHLCHVADPCGPAVRGLLPVVRGPDGLVDKEPHGLDVFLVVEGEPVVDAGGKDDQVPLEDVDPQPLVGLVPHVKVPGPVQNEPDLLVVVDVLSEKDLELLFKLVLEAFPRASNLVPVVELLIFF